MLRPEADSPGIAGRVYDESPDGRNALLFCYQIIRVWQCPVEAVLGGGLAALPLAPLSDRKGHSLRQVIDRIQDRLDRHATPEDAKHVWAATYILMGLSFSVEEATEVLAGAQAMRESATYQAILQEGRKTGLEEGVAQGRQEGIQAGIRDGRRQEAVHFLLRLASRRLGHPSQEVLTRLQAIDSVEAIETLGEKLLEVESWEELLN